MASQPPTSRASQRERGLELVHTITVVSTLGGVGLTVVFALLAADSFAGHNAAAAATDSTQTVPGPTQTVPPTASGDEQPQPPPTDSLGNSNQAPAVVSGGS